MNRSVVEAEHSVPYHGQSPSSKKYRRHPNNASFGEKTEVGCSGSQTYGISPDGQFL
jgi:hypothetical protein